METEQVSAVAKLNDAFRRRGDGVTITLGVQEMEDLSGLLDEIRWFCDFDSDNDPYGEHDFGSVSWRGETVFWKIDYYDESLRGWCDPLSPECHRILTVMLASEY